MKTSEVKRGGMQANCERFDFSSNWASFLKNFNDAKIAESERALKEIFEVDTLEGEKLLDAGSGSGSGIHSLAARRLKANVVSLDYDCVCVACTQNLKDRYFADDPDWSISEGSVLDHGLSGILRQV
ncbi:MAG: 50S ribosomal protein L11 methyltransferase [Helicobacteraceae bacterium]|jgi:2-polyprenyl-6-hydroxyphenyl methylase/3-demethylubiquinone-9 3-methyltransferase|nr:50S ribosomal protein L11 methyltransferase [Helicobacteraceae bacterium]